MSMLTGRRRPCLVLIEQPVEGADGQYGPQVTWTAVKQVWVSMDPVRGNERFKSNEIESAVSHDIRGDYYDLVDVTSRMRVVYDPTMSYGTVPTGAAVYEILAVLVDHNSRGDIALKVEQEGRNYGEI